MIRLTVMVTGVVGASLSFLGNTVLEIWLLTADMAYCVIFPQLICVIFFPLSNGYGAIGAYFLGVLVRLLSGEPLIGLSPVIHFPGGEIVDGVYVQQAPVRTIAMFATLICILLLSYLFTKLFHNSILPKTWDVLEVSRSRKDSMDQTRREAEREEVMMMSPTGPCVQ